MVKMPTLKVPVEMLELDVGFDVWSTPLLVFRCTVPLVASIVDPSGTDFVPLPRGAKLPLGRSIRTMPLSTDATAVFPETGAAGVRSVGGGAGIGGGGAGVVGPGVVLIVVGVLVGW